MISNVIRDLLFERNQPLKSGDFEHKKKLFVVFYSRSCILPDDGYMCVAETCSCFTCLIRVAYRLYSHYFSLYVILKNKIKNFRVSYIKLQQTKKKA
jgi:hypothetical protein